MHRSSPLVIVPCLLAGCCAAFASGDVRVAHAAVAVVTLGIFVGTLTLRGDNAVAPERGR